MVMSVYAHFKNVWETGWYRKSRKPHISIAIMGYIDIPMAALVEKNVCREQLRTDFARRHNFLMAPS